MTKVKQKYKSFASLLFFVALLEFLFMGYLFYQDNGQKIHAQTYTNNVAAKFSTELYFENPASLPKNLQLFKEKKFSFTIRNREGKPMTYKYKAYIDTNGSKRILEKNKVSINNNESKTIEVKYRLYIPLGASQIFVKLLDNQQNINFWMK